MLKYTFDSGKIDIEETRNGEDAEFTVRLANEPETIAAWKAVMRYFEDNEEITDVLFYAYPERVCRAIVQQRHYADFLGELIKRRLLRSLEWIGE